MSKAASTLLLLILVMAGCLSADMAADFYPTEIGYTAIYEELIEGVVIDTFEVELIDVISEEGSDTYTLVATYADGWTDTSAYIIADDGVYVPLVITEALIVDLDLPEFIKFLPAELNVGDTWVAMEYDTAAPYPPNPAATIAITAEYVGEFLRNETIEVAAGVFENCAVIEAQINALSVIRMGSVVIGEEELVLNHDIVYLSEGMGEVLSYRVEGPDTVARYELVAYSHADIDEGITQPNDLEISTYPSPFNGSCTFELPLNTNRIDITDVSGRLVHSAKVNESTYNWTPQESILSGVYIVNIGTIDGKSGNARVVYMK